MATEFISTAARVESLKPSDYRLAIRHAHTSQPTYVLQGYYTWICGNNGGGEWRDIPLHILPPKD